LTLGQDLRVKVAIRHLVKSFKELSTSQNETMVATQENKVLINQLKDVIADMKAAMLEEINDEGYIDQDLKPPSMLQ